MLFLASGADPQRENFEPLFFREEDENDCDEDDEGFIPGTSPLSMAANSQVGTPPPPTPTPWCHVGSDRILKVAVIAGSRSP